MDLDDEQEQEEDEQLPPVHLTLSNIKSLTTLLQAMKISAKQVCTIAAGSAGMSMTVHALCGSHVAHHNPASNAKNSAKQMCEQHSQWCWRTCVMLLHYYVLCVKSLTTLLQAMKISAKQVCPQYSWWCWHEHA
jgi:hypothetical protein